MTLLPAESVAGGAAKNSVNLAGKQVKLALDIYSRNLTAASSCGSVSFS